MPILMQTAVALVVLFILYLLSYFDTCEDCEYSLNTFLAACRHLYRD